MDLDINESFVHLNLDLHLFTEFKDSKQISLPLWISFNVWSPLFHLRFGDFRRSPVHLSNKNILQRHFPLNLMNVARKTKENKNKRLHNVRM